MKTSIKAIIAIAVAGIFAAAAQAQTKPEIAIVNMATLFDNHYKTVAQKAKLEEDNKKASEEFQKIAKDGQVILDQMKALQDQFKNPALNEASKNKIQEQYQIKEQEIQQKQNEANQFRMSIQRALQESAMTFRAQLVSEITEVVNAVAKEKKLNMVLDVSGPSANLIPLVIYSNGVLDITKDIADRINKARPADAPAVSFPAPAAK